MLLQKKNKGFFVDLNDHTFTVARTSVSGGSLVIEEIKSCPSSNSSAVSAAIKDVQLKRSGSSYIHATCGVYSAKRLVRRATLDPKRLKEPAYLNEFVAAQFRIEPDKYTMVALNPASGTDFDASSGNDKEVVFAGMMTAEITSIQKQLLETGVYPERLELGTVSMLGGLVAYLRHADIKSPTLVLEVDAESTQSYILSDTGLDAARTIPQGLDAMVPVVQKELGLKDEESARKLFYSNTFDFTGMGPSLIKKLIKELQSSIGFYEVQTGQSIGQVYCTLLPTKMTWLQGAIANQLGVNVLTLNFAPWLQAAGIAFADTVPAAEIDPKNLGLVSLMLPHENGVAS